MSVNKPLSHGAALGESESSSRFPSPIVKHQHFPFVRGAIDFVRMETAATWPNCMKILVAIANFGTKNDNYAQRVIDTYRAFGHDTTIVVHSDRDKSYGPGIQVHVGLPSENPHSLPFAHRKLFVDCQNDYDLFIYSEDDTELTEHHLDAFLEVSSKLPEDKIAGFIRYEEASDGRRFYSTVHGRYYWDPNSVFRIDDRVFARYTNDHSACYILTRDQLKHCINSGGFATVPHRERYAMLESGATDPYTRCGLTKVMCISHIDEFCLHHLPSNYVGRIGVEIDEIDRQIRKLLEIEEGRACRTSLFDPRTRLGVPTFDKKYFEPFRPEVLKLLPSGVKHLLSVGCERGLTEGQLVEAGCKVTAVPLDCVIAESARMRVIETVTPNFETAAKELKNHRFDAILFNNILQYLRDPPSIIEKYLPLMNNGGSVLASFDNFEHVSLIRRRLCKDPIALRLNDIGGFRTNGIHLADSRTVKDWLRAAGLEPQREAFGADDRYSKHSRWSLGILDRWLCRRGAVSARRNGAV